MICDLTLANYTGVIIPNAICVLCESREGKASMVNNEYRPSAPDNWFVDPVRLGVPGVRRADGSVSGMGTVSDGAGDDAELAWQTDSLCAQTDPEAFFPEKGGSTRDAKKICSSCEVRSQCLQYALENDERFGIWGGLSERERRKLRKRA
jgi:WhiB family redox-sensing transcriptional regulator